MNKKELKKLTEMLHRKSEEMKNAYARTKSSSLESSDDGSMDIADIASSAYNREFLFSLSDEERKVLVLVEEAIKRVEEGGYGKCSACGKNISDPRLNAVPGQSTAYHVRSFRKKACFKGKKRYTGLAFSSTLF